jgi:quercetin dioxygenase-like cupin family protein
VEFTWFDKGDTMEDRRTFLGLAAAALVPAGLTAQTPEQPAARRPSGELARHALTGPLEGFEAVLLELRPSPQGPRTAGPGHRHPGPVLGYVAEGQLLFGTNHEPAQTLQAGATFFEPTGALHSTFASVSADSQARAIVFMIVPKGAPLAVRD